MIFWISVHHFITIWEFKLELRSGNGFWFADHASSKGSANQKPKHTYTHTKGASDCGLHLQTVPRSSQPGLGSSSFQSTWVKYKYFFIFASTSLSTQSTWKTCASFHHHMGIQTGVTIWKRLLIRRSCFFRRIGESKAQTHTHTQKGRATVVYTSKQFLARHNQGWGQVLFRVLESSTSTFSYLQVQV